MGQLGRHKSTKIIVIDEGPLPIWKLVIASFLYALMFFLFAWACWFFYQNTFYIDIAVYLVLLLSTIFPFAFFYSLHLTYYFDIDKKQFKEEFKIVFYTFGKWKPMPELEYVSIFYNRKVFEVNLWYKRNKHFKLYNFYLKKDAIETGRKIAIELNVSLLDSTEKGNSKWIL